VAWDDGPAQRQAILDLLALPPERARVQALVERFTWERVAAQIADCYYLLQSLPARRQHAV
jgi:glycosyltransferase involved in cell wall biosynthesis